MNKYIQDLYQDFIFKSRYARSIPIKGSLYRKETREEAFNRLLDFFQERHDISDIRSELFDASIKLEIVPAMRVLASAGKALKTNNLFAYNCSYTVMDSLYSVETLFNRSLHGVGVGYSVEFEFVNKLPIIPKMSGMSGNTFLVPDSKEGWVHALRYVLQTLYSGLYPKLDYSAVRPKGTPLKTTGGYASGPDPLRISLEMISDIIIRASGRQLIPIELSDICCIMADAVVVGGVRRVALICLSSIDDIEMRMAKHGFDWYKEHPYRTNANFSVAYNEKPSIEVFNEEWEFLKTGCSGERGIFNRQGALDTLPPRRRELLNYYGILDSFSKKVGTNPCGEIILLDQVCNLSEAIIRPNDSVPEILEKLRLATIYGVLQSDLLYFPTTPELNFRTSIERLLGVSITGIMSNPITYKPTKQFLELAKETVIETSIKYARRFHIPESTACTCIKPSGTVTEVTGAFSPGINPAYSKYFIRTVRNSKDTPFTKAVMASGIPHHVKKSDSLFHFPTEVPDGVLTGEQVDAQFQLDLWLKYKTHYCEHNPSCSIYVKPNEWDLVKNWIYSNWEHVCGLAFFPYTDPNVSSTLNASYDLSEMPFRKISKEEYDSAVEAFPKNISFEDFTEDMPTEVPVENIGGCEGPSCLLKQDN